MRDPLENVTMNAAQAARLLMLSHGRISQLEKAGTLTRHDGISFRLLDVVHGYLTWRNSTDRRKNRNAADARVRDARAEEIQMRVGLQAGRLIDHAEHVEVVRELCGLVRAEFGGLPARLTRDLGERRKIESAVYEILTRLADRAEALANVNAARREAMATDEDDDAGPVGGDQSDVSGKFGATGST